VVLLDLELTIRENNREAFYEGVPLGEEIRGMLPDAVIIIYSGAIEKQREESFDHFEECRASADLVMAGSIMLSMRKDKLACEIERLRQKRLASSCSAHVDFGADLATRAVCDIFGRDVIARLCCSCCEGKPVIKICALSAGYSGAAIVRVIGSDADDHKGEVRLVLKISASEDPLWNELERLPRMGTRFDTASILPRRGEVKECDGVKAISMPEVTGMVLLRDFLEKPKLAKADKDSLRKMVAELLVAPARDARVWAAFSIKDVPFRFRTVALYEIDSFLGKACRMCNILNASQIESVATVRGLVGMIDQGKWGFSCENRLAAYLHGDFHCRNVFVERQIGAKLIDFGRADIYPRLFDMAALDVDLMLGVLDSSSGDDFRLERVSEWLGMLSRTFPFAESGEFAYGEANSEWLRSIIHAAIMTDIEDSFSAEYSETVLFHLFRYLRFSDISFAKKILAILLIELLAERLQIISVKRG
jgi:hypothetical protein